MTAPPSTTRNHSKTTNVDHVQTDLLEQPEQAAAEPKFTLSATQVAASVAAAVTAAVVGSRLGVAGTVIGAGLASVISVVGGAIFGHSILFTRKQVKRAVLQVRGTGTETAMVPTSPTAKVPASPDDDRTVVIPAVNAADLTMVLGSRPGPERAEPSRPRPTRRRVGTGLILAVTAAAAVFASSLGAVTLIEAVKGSPLAGGDSGGLSVLGGNGGTSVQDTDTGTPSADPTTVTQTVTSEVVSTATTTEPASSTAATPSGAEQSSTPTPTGPTSDPAPTTQPTTPSPSGAAGTGTAEVLSGSAGSGAAPR